MKNNYNKKIFQVFSPVRTKDIKIISNLVETLIGQSDYIDHVFFVVEKDIEQLFKQELLKYEIDNKIKYVIAVSKNKTTKLTKMSIISNLVKDDKFIIVLDEDDQLLDMSNLYSFISENKEADLILTPLTFDYEGVVYKKSYYPENPTWEDDKTFPYYNNHNTFPIGKIFKSFFEKSYERIFQKHEDVFRSVFYIDNSINPVSTNLSSNSIIKYNILKGREHVSLIFDKESISLWMNALAINIKNSNLKLIESNPFYKSQKNALIRILRTIFIVYDLGLLEEESFAASQDISKRLGLKFEKECLFNTKGLEEFYQNVINDKKIKMH